MRRRALFVIAFLTNVACGDDRSNLRGSGGDYDDGRKYNYHQSNRVDIDHSHIGGPTTIQAINNIGSTPTVSTTEHPTVMHTEMPTEMPTERPSEMPHGCPFFGRTGRQELIGSNDFLDNPPSTNCKDGFCVPPSGNESGSIFYPTLPNGSTVICVDVLPPPLTAPNASAASLLCLELAANRSCELPSFVNGDYCALTCGVCEQPIWSDGETGAYSGPQQVLPDGLYNSSRFQTRWPRKSCEQYNVTEVVEAIKAWATSNPVPPNLDLAKLIRAGFHDAADYNKWTGTGGPDGNLVMYQEAYYGQSHNLPLLVKSSLVQFKTQFGEALSWGDLLQIASMTAVELAGGPNFEMFNFEPGRIDNEEGLVSLDGLLPSAGVTNTDFSYANINTNRDFWYRATFDDFDFTAAMGGHTMGGTFNKDFTGTPNTFNNEYFINLLSFEVPGCCNQTNGGGYVQLPTDRALLTDPTIRTQVELYAANQSAFFNDYVKVVRKMSLFGQDVSVRWCYYNYTQE